MSIARVLLAGVCAGVSWLSFPCQGASEIPAPAEARPSPEEARKKLSAAREQVARCDQEVREAGGRLQGARERLLKEQAGLSDTARLREGLLAEIETRLSTNTVWAAHRDGLAEAHRRYTSLQGVTRVDDAWRASYAEARRALREKELGQAALRKQLVDEDPVLRGARDQLTALDRRLDDALSHDAAYKQARLDQTAALNKLFNAKAAEDHALSLLPPDDPARNPPADPPASPP